MKISIITVFPEVHHTFLATSIIGRAVEKNLISFNLVRLADFCSPKERIDEPTAGPGAGMIIKPKVIEKALHHCEQLYGPGCKIFFSPQGTKLTQPLLRNIAAQHVSKDLIDGNPEQPSTTRHLILICSRYEGMDARVEQIYADLVLSIGDYVLMGGDIPAQVFLEGFLRLVPGVIGAWGSVEQDSFSGPFFDHPEYGLPLEWHNMRIPEIVQSGNHAAIEAWRQDEACKATLLTRFDWFASAQPSKEDRQRAQRFIPHHYVALMHTQVKRKDGRLGTTSITSIDLHDTARSCSTYGIKNFFMVSPLIDQQSIMKTLLDFWKSDEGKQYNQSRYDAVSRVKPAYGLDDVIASITAEEGQRPLIITTSAKHHIHTNTIDYTSQGRVWTHQQPVLFLFGTGQGLADELIEQSDFLLIPVEGMTDYNHLSVRSAIAIILDRWLGLHPKL